jgi:hypothetical protein
VGSGVCFWTLSAIADADGPELAQDFHVHMSRETGEAVYFKDAAAELSKYFSVT